MKRRDHAQDLVAHAAQDVLVGERAAADEGKLVLEPGLRVLLREPERVRAREDRVGGVHVAPELRQVRRKVGVPSGGQSFCTTWPPASSKVRWKPAATSHPNAKS